MASIKLKEFPHVGRGFTIYTQIIPLAGLVTVLRAARGNEDSLFRYSRDGGNTYSDWEVFSDGCLKQLGRLSDSSDLVLDYVTKPFLKSKASYKNSPKQASTIIYDKTIFKTFFDSNDPQVLAWAINVLEKLFEPGIVPLYVSRNNQDDYNSFFLAITHYFAFIVIYARNYRQLENSDLLMKEFIENWGIVYENVKTLEQRKYLFSNWIQEFYKRGTSQVVNTGGTIEGELRRLVGYEKPNEFIFAALAPQSVGWCLGFSSPTWYGTETVNEVSKGWDFGILDFENPGVGQLEDYPIIGKVERKSDNGIQVFQPIGTGRVGISSEVDKTKVLEVYPGLDYEITVWVKALNLGAQNIEFGVHCYDSNFDLINQVRITDWRETNSFFEGERYQSPCKIPGVYYELRGIIYNILEEKDENLYLNFENGRPLRFMGGIKYMAPYIVQNRDVVSCDILIAGVCLKPLELPFSQGYLGQKNVIAMYAQIKSARTKSDIEEFIRRYLVSYKNVVSYTWLDWVVRTSYFLTFFVKRELDQQPVSGAQVTLDNGFSSETDSNGYVRFEIPMNLTVGWTVLAKGVTQQGSILLDKDRIVNVIMNLPLDVNIEIIEPDWGEVQVEGTCLPNTEITLIATPKPGYTFIKWNIITDSTENSDNPLQYWIGSQDLNIQAIFERNSELSFSPNIVEIPAEGGRKTITVSSTKKWVIEPLEEDWATVSPMEGEAGESTISIEINDENNE